MTRTKDILYGFSKAFFSDEVRLGIFVSLLFVFLGYNIAGVVVLVVMGGLCSVLVSIYLIKEKRLMKFFWLGLFFGISYLLYTSAPDLNTLKFSSDFIVKDRPSQIVILAATGVFHGYAAQKYLGGTSFIARAAEEATNRDVLVLDPKSSVSESLAVIFCTDNLSLAEFLPYISKTTHVFAFNVSSDILIINIDSTESFKALIALDEGVDFQEGSLCSSCHKRGASYVGIDGIEVISSAQMTLCEDCITKVIEAGIEKDIISETDVYAVRV